LFLNLIAGNKFLGIVADRIAWDSSAKNYLYESEKVLIFVSGDGGFNWVQVLVFIHNFNMAKISSAFSEV